MEIGNKYESFSALEKTIDAYCHANFINLWKRDSRRIAASRIIKKIKLELVYYEVKYACIHGGRTYFKRGKGMHDTSTFKLQEPCMFFLRFRVDDKGKNLELRSLHLNHNHEISKISFLHYPGERKLLSEMENEARNAIALKANKKCYNSNFSKNQAK
ncbi:unnamed protein product [Brassicogethes aeneus]|uniref:ZSWIM3 N-terminal domain-containing protein n=1 Tax=Brassicogethes aeneus TaxID=1431903 RepID=A0A9P0BCJ0_BRAAE|nr:unnamed protein product [Brassicogethes aeneus]